MNQHIIHLEMKEKFNKYLPKFLRFVVSHIKEMVVSFIFSTIFYTLYCYLLKAPLDDAWGWLQAYGRVLQDGFRSGFMRGIPFRSTQGTWAVDWRLGGQPFVHVVIFYVFAGISIFGTTSCAIYLLRKYHSFGRLRGIWTYRGHPKRFWGYFSASIAAALIMMSLIGFTGTMINPNVIVPAEPSKDYLGLQTTVSETLFLTITRHAIVRVEPSVLEKENMTGWLSCIITTPEGALWNISDANTATILLNSIVTPCSVSVHCDSNGTASIVAQFDKNLLNCVFGDTDAMERGNVTLNVDGQLKNGDYFAGSSQLRIER